MKLIATSQSTTYMLNVRRRRKAYSMNWHLHFLTIIVTIRNTQATFISQRPLLVEPLNWVVLGEDGSILEPTIHLIWRLLGMEAVEGGFFVFALITQTEKHIAGTIRGQGWNLDAPENVHAVGRSTNADEVEVVGRKARELVVAQVCLYDSVSLTML